METFLSTSKPTPALEKILVDELYKPHRGGDFKSINYHHFAEQHISGLAVDLAYAIGNTFGEQFESWHKDHQTSSTNTKVVFFQIFELSVKDVFEGSPLCKNLGVQLW